MILKFFILFGFVLCVHEAQACYRSKKDNSKVPPKPIRVDELIEDYKRCKEEKNPDIPVYRYACRLLKRPTEKKDAQISGNN